MTWRPRDAEAFTHALLASLPLGEIWQRVLGSTLVRVVHALAAVVGRWATRVGTFLIAEAFPPHSFLLLPDWERVLGLPEPCFPAAQTLEERRLQVREKLGRRPGGQNRPYFISLANRLGYHEYGPSPYQLQLQVAATVGKQKQIRIREFQPFMFGVSRLGDARWRLAPPEMRFTWVVRVPGRRLSWFRFGESCLGQDPHVRIRRAEDLECVFRNFKPAHTVLVFDYEGI
ncbi:MAG: YmfQ family protein [Hyphomicrobium sp.]|uniref:YmfQ family protein n=1 Tax=Hyphomicrobium sp. TaxID=82 RepID=UPI003D0FD708